MNLEITLMYEPVPPPILFTHRSATSFSPTIGLSLSIQNHDGSNTTQNHNKSHKKSNMPASKYGGSRLSSLEQEECPPGFWRNFMKAFHEADSCKLQAVKDNQLKRLMALSSGKKSISVIVAATNGLVLDNIEQLTKAARKRGMAPISVFEMSLMISAKP
jgi:hypothetical protein